MSNEFSPVGDSTFNVIDEELECRAAKEVGHVAYLFRTGDLALIAHELVATKFGEPVLVNLAPKLLPVS